ncbi:rhodanese-related sulfurtransferase [Halobacteroides halobius DSM 5150]|uniref:thiosulfate sulfurtransferase n=1 Tax=Halobacteroides halobius (strain ATCC 35273 / DSM 5150 / MD-1) TaxID=748449 RepID=L0K9S9_HALHC|nr:rhodanese-like domain-containing protein [Halobacteroides halobius]AGB42067.1 rhodanese-related sulfurtransferase [Halobacteroides halobius DSM 5150]
MKKKYGLITVLSLVMVFAVSTVTMAGFFDWLIGGSNFKYYAPKKLKQSIEQEKDFFLVDIQPQEDFKKHHIQGAISTSAYPVKSKQDQAKLDKILPQLKKSNNDIVIVCPRGGGGAERTYKYLSSQGIKEQRLYILEGGQAGWPYEQLLANKKVEIITTEELATKLGAESLAVVDVRSDVAYNGWKLKGEVRGGHIKGAAQLPYSLANKLKAKKLKSVLKKKGVTKDKKVVVYGYGSAKSTTVANKLMNLGYNNVVVYKAGISTWAANDDLPMKKLANYQKLVYPAWVKKLINNKDRNDYKIVEVSYGEPKKYKQGHIPGAIHLNTNGIEGKPDWNIVADEKLEDYLEKLGITTDTTVVLYGSNSTMAAARAASAMMYAGVEDVRLLNGNLKAWQEAGYRLEKKVNQPTAVADFGADVPVNPNYIINTRQAKEILKDPNAELVSIRSWAEYIGKTSGYSYIEPKGRIAGAVWGHAGSDAYHMEHFENVDGTLRSYPQIKEMWKEWGITSNKEVSFFCGTGWRASEAFFMAYLMGWKDISVYDGGWYVWSKNPDNPIEYGDPRK